MVLVGIGVEVTFEVLQAAALLRAVSPGLRVRVVNVTDLMIVAAESRHPHGLGAARFDELFTADRPLLFNYHGYPTELQGLLFGRLGGQRRVSVAGYVEEGSTTTPFDMMLVNGVSRFHLAEKALREGAEAGNAAVREGLESAVAEVRERARRVKEYIAEHGKGESAFLVPFVGPCFTIGECVLSARWWVANDSSLRPRGHLRDAQVWMRP